MRPEISFAFSVCSPLLSAPSPARLSLVSSDDDDVITSAPPLAEVSRVVVINEVLDDDRDEAIAG